MTGLKVISGYHISVDDRSGPYDPMYADASFSAVRMVSVSDLDTRFNDCLGSANCVIENLRFLSHIISPRNVDSYSSYELFV